MGSVKHVRILNQTLEHFGVAEDEIKDVAQILDVPTANVAIVRRDEHAIWVSIVTDRMLVEVGVVREILDLVGLVRESLARLEARVDKHQPTLAATEAIAVCGQTVKLAALCAEVKGVQDEH